MCLLEGLHYSGRHEPSFTPGEISLRGDFHHYQATEKSWAHNGPVLSVPYLINLFSENSVKDSVLEHCHALLYTVFFWIMASSFTMIYWLIYLFISESWRNGSKSHLVSLLHTRKIEENYCFLMDLGGRKVPLESPQLPCQLNQFTRWSLRVTKLKEVCMSVMRDLESNHSFVIFEERTVLISLNFIYSHLQ